MNKAILIIVIIFFNLLNASTDKIEVVTEKYPPFQWEENGKIVGPSAQIIEAIIKKVGIEYTLDIYPWARAYKIAQNRKNVLIYSITRSEKREKLFKWVGALSSHKVYFWKLKSKKDINIKTLDDAKQFFIAGVRKDAKTQYLTNKGFENIAIVHSTDIAINLLFSNKVSLLIENEDLPLQVKKLGYDFNEMEKVYYLEGFSQELFVAFSLMTDGVLVEKFKKALEELKLSGEFDKIISKYRK